MGLLPWIWIIPFNQYFWDDWAIASRSNWGDQVNYWSGGAKHFANPLIYFLLLPIGPWVFHTLIIFASVIGAYSLSRILAKISVFSPAACRWSGPLLLAMPVFHARFSVATFEYSFAIAALLGAWAVLLNTRSISGISFSVVLLLFAIGVPSLAILFPLIWVHVTWQFTKSKSLRAICRAAGQSIYIPFVPLLFALIFAIFIDGSNKYRVSRDGLTDWSNDFVRLLFITILVLAALHRFKRSSFAKWLFVALSGHLVYITLFPYFAVGYKPLYDLQPWTMRVDLRNGWQMRFLIPSLLLLLIGVTVYSIVDRQLPRMLNRAGIVGFGFTVLFGAISVGLGPLDWESRHWLIAWPALVVLVLALAASASEVFHRKLLASIFTIFLFSSLAISSEYFVDILKQRALVHAATAELQNETQPISHLVKTRLFILETNSSTDALNARFRNYRSYEWKGILADGLGVSPVAVSIFDFWQVRKESAISCDYPFKATLIRPTVESSRIDALTQFRVEVTFRAAPIDLCFSRSR